jgi:hypothetical protein
MNAATIDRIVSLIPERTARLSSGVAFTPEASVCRHPERLAQLALFLNWMSPLNPITKDDQRALGLLNAAGRPVHAVDLEEDELLDPSEEDVAQEAAQVAAVEAIEEAEEAEEMLAVN